MADKAEDIALRLRGVPAQQEIRRTEMKETQGVALDKLAQVHQSAEFVRRRRDADGHDGVAGLGGRQQMAHRTDAADPRRDAGHFIVGTALAEFFKAAKLHDMELGVGDVAFIVEKDADLGVPFDAGHGINEDAFCHDSYCVWRRRSAPGWRGAPGRLLRSLHQISSPRLPVLGSPRQDLEHEV